MNLRPLPTLCTVLLAAHATCLAEITNRYLFIGHPRDDGPGEIVQRDVERVDFSAYDLLLLGGDYTWRGTGTRATVDYLDAVFDLAAPTTLAAIGNHDTANKSFFTDVTGRPTYYTHKENGIAFVVLDTTNDGQNIVGGELQMLQDTVANLTNCTHLVLVHHHLIWLADYAPLAHLQGSPLIGASSNNLSGLNFYDDVYPLLLQAHAQGVEVMCLAGDRTGSDTEEFFIDHTTVDGVRFIGAGFKEELTPSLRTAVILEHDSIAGTVDCTFTHLSDLPRIPDESLIINELHYDPPPVPGNGWSFIELCNRGHTPYDLSGATFSSGVTFTFPPNTIVAPQEYVVVAADATNYAGLAAPVFDYAGDTKPDSNDPMWLRDSRGLEIDYVSYGVSAPWPSEPDNLGPSLMLIDPRLDNTLATSWAVSDQDGGTPGATNIPLPSLSQHMMTATEVSLLYDGVVPGAWYHIEYTSTLQPGAWSQAGSATQASGTFFPFTDTSIAGASRRFYRLARSFP